MAVGEGEEEGETMAVSIHQSQETFWKNRREIICFTLFFFKGGVESVRLK